MTRAGTLDSPTHRARRWPSVLVLPAVAALIAAAASPSIAHALPRFFFPAIALVGGVLAARGFVRAFLRLARGERSWRGRDLLSFGTLLIAFVFLAVLPLVRLFGVLTAPSTGPPYILATFGDWIGGEGYPHPGRHRGIDVKGPVGSDVLAAADGRVVLARDHGDLCGLIIVIAHEPHGYRTIYCHSATLLVRPGDDVRRGQRIGTLGTTGQLAWPGYEHVHLELQRGADRNDVEDPMQRLAGCFDAQASYPTDRLVLTYPVSCREGFRPARRHAEGRPLHQRDVRSQARSPVVRSSYVAFTDELEQALSPQRHLDKLVAPLIVAYGTFETPEFQRQSRDFAAAVTAAGKRVELLVGAGYNHFELYETLANPYGVLGRAVLEQMGLAGR